MAVNTILHGDSLEMLKTFPDEFVNCVVTSPPYWGLRDYGHDGQLGLEKTPEEYVAKLVEIFREIRRVLRKDATVWLNLGDTYSAHKDCKSVSDTLRVGGKSEQANVIEKGKSHSRNSKMLKQQGYKNKDLIGIPWRVAFALQADGWYLRQDIIWHKPNPMPESVTDRCTKAHEYIFLLSKSAKYYYDAEAIKEQANYDGRKDEQFKGATKSYNGVMPDGQPQSFAQNGHSRWNKDSDGNRIRNKRSVWTVNTEPYPDAHFAVYPQALIEPCILAGCPEGGIVLDPFFGSGTTGLVALRARRKFIGIELNAEYIKLAEKRLQPLLNQLTLF